MVRMGIGLSAVGDLLLDCTGVLHASSHLECTCEVLWRDGGLAEAIVAGTDYVLE